VGNFDALGISEAIDKNGTGDAASVKL